jgi:phage protein D
MLSSLLGIRLVLMMGEIVPRPAPYEVVQALNEVEVTNSLEEGDGFSLTFTLSKERRVDYPLLRNPLFKPASRIIIAIILGAKPEVLIDGLIEYHQITVGNEPGTSTLTVMGKDISTKLDEKAEDEPFPNQSDSNIVRKVLTRPQYAQYGFEPKVTVTTDTPSETDRIVWRQTSDLQFLQMLAQRNGFTFYMKPRTIGRNVAYWGLENRLDIPQPALTMNMGHATNVRSLQFTQDSRAPVKVSTQYLEKNTGTTLSIPSPPSLRTPPLAQTPTPARRQEIQRGAARKNFFQAQLSAAATVTNAPDAVQGQGELDTVRYGHILRARQLVGVRGAGLSYDGNYFVNQVSHRIRQGNYTQSFSIRREGTGALVPTVRV